MKIEQPPLYFTFPQEVWPAVLCAKMAKQIARDGLGTKYGFPGACPGVKSGPVRYNGGTSIDGVWYQGVIHQLPKLSAGYSWIFVPTWCWRIVKDKS